MPPLVAFLLTLAYLTIYPTVTSVPALLFWCIPAVLLLGAILGARAITGVIRAHRVRGRAVVWLVGATAIELLCLRMFVGFTLPWI